MKNNLKIVKDNTIKPALVKVLNFRTLLDDEDNDIYRDIEIRSDQTFENFHIAIQNSFGFDKSQMASFYLCNDKWSKKKEITLLNMNDADYNDADYNNDESVLVMNKTLLGDLVISEGQKLIYIFDFLNVWTFFIELISFRIPEKGKKYPACTNSVGKAPEQYSKNIAVDLDEESIESVIGDPESLLEDSDVFNDSYEEYNQFRTD